MTYHGNYNKLFLNDGQGGLSTSSGGDLATYQTHASSKAVVAADFNGDNSLDLYVANHGYTNHLFFNSGTGSFTAASGNSNAAVSVYDGSEWAVAFDADNDGDMDLYVCNAPSSTSGVSGEANRLLLNDGTGDFTAVTNDPSVAELGRSYGAVAFDADNDGALARASPMTMPAVLVFKLTGLALDRAATRR